MRPLLGVLIWWRTNHHTLLLDRARANQLLQTGEHKKFTRLFLVRENSQEPWLTYGFDRVTFGDHIAPLALELAKSRAADLGQDLHPSTADQIKQKLYVDDGAIAAESRDEVKRMRG